MYAIPLLRKRQAEEASLAVTLVTRISVIVADVLVLALTLIKTYRQVMNGRKAGVTMSLSMCLLRDGNSYAYINAYTSWLTFPQEHFISCTLGSHPNPEFILTPPPCCSILLALNVVELITHRTTVS